MSSSNTNGAKISGKQVALSTKNKISSTSNSTFNSIGKSKISARPGGWWIYEDENGIRRRFAYSEEKGKFFANLSGKAWAGQWVEKQKGGGASSRSQLDSDLVSQFPGKVRKVLVQIGSQIQEGEPMVLVEAMKMEFVIRAPFSAKILKVLVQEGQQLSPGDRFVELEEIQSGG